MRNSKKWGGSQFAEFVIAFLESELYILFNSIRFTEKNTFGISQLS